MSHEETQQDTADKAKQTEEPEAGERKVEDPPDPTKELYRGVPTTGKAPKSAF